MDFAGIDSLVSVPKKGDQVFKDECVFSFAAPDDENGLFICLRTFLGVGSDFIDEYVRRTGNSVFLQYKIVKVFKARDSQDDEPVKPKKLAIGIPGGFELPEDKYTVSERWCLRRFPGGHKLDIPCPVENSAVTDMSHLEDLRLSVKVMTCINNVQRCDSAILVSERACAAAAWEAENACSVSKFALDLVQLDNGVTVPPCGLKCHICDLTTNLWMNLTDGTICCGRRFWDGSGGNNHAIEHYERTKYPLAVKLGTITPKSAEVFSYAEDNMVTDPLLAQHLAHFGIDMQRQRKTDRTVMEMEVEANERLGEWLTLQEADRTLTPLYGPGLTGLVNLGNTCYINSAVQVLFATEAFRRRYALALGRYVEAAMDAVARNGSSTAAVESFGLQMSKLGQALCSGVYSFPPVRIGEMKGGEVVPKQPGIRPRMFRHLMGRTNTEFASKQQQDVQEFLVHLFDLVKREVGENCTIGVPSPLHSLAFTVEDRIQCGLTGKVQYKERVETILCLPIPLEAATNRAEVNAYEKRRSEAEKTKAPFKEDPVYLKIGIDACLSSWAAQERVLDFISPATDPPCQRTTAIRSSRLVTFPDILCVQMLKFTLGENWLPRKLNVAIQLDRNSTVGGCPQPGWRLDLSALRALGGLQPGEVAMPSETSDQQSYLSTVAADEAVVGQLQSMGFTRNACLRACLATASNAEAASNWLMEHLDDPDLNDPIPGSTLSPFTASSVTVDTGALVTLLEMGITEDLAKRALEACGNDVEAAINMAFSNPDVLLNSAQQMQQSNSTAVTAASLSKITKETLSNGDPSRYELIAFISHMGESTAAGHYVCHIKRTALSKGIPGLVPACAPSPYLPDGEKEDEWVIFNDEKVCRSESPPFQHAYLYFFRRV
ncbi:ubiquitin carboxyl terminal hydrolase 5 [Echinococcus multilocularis]|uniref:Ubiquitin carboxyl-terminal hydrolase n=1 Tax=Echinococcus multilocularis TaxID=6211 RepID=A0A087VYJ9_ECHMU|nr:ubiquitin carboxyl terminal hydrolase 5 [Echinococcus multilocularis]